MSVTVELDLPAAGAKITRADLTFECVDHSGPSYEARVFLDWPTATVETPVDDPHYAGSFSVFGHGGCFGEEGHCQVRPAVTTFDRRPPHQLVPATRVLVCTESIRQLVEGGRSTVTVTAVAVVRASALADPV